MKISVALCTYNGARFLEAQLQSVAAQDRRPDELVICDDGSTDETEAIVGRFAAVCPFEVRWRKNRQNLGATGNFAQAVALCRGDLIALSDQDDVWLPDKLDRLERAFVANPDVGFVFSDALLIDEEDRLLPHGLWEAIAFERGLWPEVNGRRAVEVLVRRNVVTGAGMAFRAAHRDMLLPIPRSWVHDGWFALLIAAVAPCLAIAEPLLKYRQHTGQQIGAKKENLYRQFLRGLRQRRMDFEATAGNYEAACQRLSKFRSRLRDARVLQLLEEKAEHFRAKARMRDPEAWRLPIIVEELCHRHYARYSRGWKSLAQDLFC
jgi:glycosyltransferase involved in cell wall biosynthesis